MPSTHFNPALIMSDGIDKSLLDRLQALRGASTTPKKPTSNPIKFDVIERAKPPTGGDVLAARLKSLRTQADSPPPRSSKSTPTKTGSTDLTTQSQGNDTTKTPSWIAPDQESDDVDALFETDDQALEEMLADADDTPPQPSSTEPREEDVKALLERLSASVPTDTHHHHSDDSDGESMTRETSGVIARYKDEVELDAGLQDTETPPGHEEEDEAARDHPPSIELPSAPGTETSTSSTQIADLTARMAALRHSSAEAQGPLPSVPTSIPTKSVKRLTSKTGYTDDDMDSWCTVCLEDATLRCLGCDEDVYCTRCWREMHVGPAAHFDDRSHKATQFTRDRRKTEKKVALGS